MDPIQIPSNTDSQNTANDMKPVRRSYKKLHFHGTLLSFGLCLVFVTAAFLQMVVSATTPTFTEYATPSPTAHPSNIAIGPDGYLWFTETDSNKIGRINPGTGAISEYDVP